MPGSAKCVVKVNVETQEVTEIGHNLKGPYIETTYPKNQFKWLRGARGKDGAIYGVPSNANKVCMVGCGMHVVSKTRDLTNFALPASCKLTKNETSSLLLPARSTIASMPPGIKNYTANERV